MKKNYRNKAIVAGVMMVAFGAYAKTPLTNTFLSHAEANDAEDAVSESQDQPKDESSDSGSSESVKKAQEVKKESAQKVEEIKKESTKKAFEIKNDSVKRQAEVLKKSKEAIKKSETADDVATEDQNADSDADGVENDGDEDDAVEAASNVTEDKSSERLKHATEKIAEAEKYILEQQNEGKDVTIALERLTQAKNMLSISATVAPHQKGDDGEASDDLVKEALKLTHTAQGDDVHDINDVDKFVKKASERINQATEKLSRLAAAGGDTKPYQAMIDAANTDLKSAKDMLLQGSLLDSAALAQKAEGEAKSSKKTIESALLALGVEDDELSGDHKSVVAKAVEDLLYVANVEGDNKLGIRVRDIARAQRDSADKVNTLVDDAQTRSDFASFLLGPKYTDLKGIQQQITDNQSRIQSLSQVKSQLTDADLQAVIQEHLIALTEENTKLQSFVSGKELNKGLFGWVFRLLQ